MGPKNEKRPKPLRIMGRPNSPPPELLTYKVGLTPGHVNATFVLHGGTT